MRTYECGLVPGLFQTAAYAREVISTDGPDHDVVLLEHLTDSRYVEEKTEVERCSAAFGRITANAPPHDASLRLIRRLKEEAS
ncbi:hypothetical protein GCM10010420_24320 [Streptomyces glaucosporus]|uniref:DUF5753 domain-containing protein n=1 Tax=Streptomyces glaucosporus TaxID=284044 RepID=A0ABN3I896_9ACTN